MFNIYLVWNLNHILKIFKASFFDIITYSYDFIEDKKYLLKIKYKSQIPGLKIDPVMVDHPRYSSKCMALFFMADTEDIHELVIDTRIVDYCDFVDYIQPININDINDIQPINIIQRQEKYWRWFQYFSKYVVDFSIKETEEKYLITLMHGMDVEISLNDTSFNITKKNLRFMELMAYVKEYEIPKLENIIVTYNYDTI